MAIKYDDVNEKALRKGASPKKQGDWAKGVVASKGTKKDKQYAPTKYNTGAEGFGRVGEAIGNWGIDRGRDVLNFLSTMGAGLAGQDVARSGGFGDWFFGSNPGDWQEKLGKPQRASKKGDKAQRQTKDGGVTEGDAYDTAMAYLSGLAGRNDARLQAMYREVADYIAGQTGATRDIYSRAAEDYRGAQQSASNAINMGVDVARQQQTKALQALGIEEAALNAIARGEDISGTQIAAQNRFADYLNTNLNRNTGAQTAALQGLLNLSQATIGEGARERAAYGERTQGQLMDLLMQQQQSRQQQAAAALEAQAKAEELALKYQPQRVTTVDDVAAATQQLLAQAQAANIPADQQRAWVEMQLKQIG